ncbi:chromosome segregation protein SMC [Rhodobacteraceae bacterium]|nr:chromosome segregation protein SMC [Paracoccaceae bacterium]
MKLRAITVENIRRFSNPVTLGGMTDGLNVLREPNEHGKSTLFDALQAAFFERHTAKGKAVQALRPHAGGAPSVRIELETAEGTFTIFKRWLSKPQASVHQGTMAAQGPLVAQADAAEDWIARSLGTDQGGPAGLIWVRQGLTALEAGSKPEREAAQAARRDLISSFTEQVEAMTGGRRMDQALARTQEELARFATGRNRNPRKGGPWQEAIDQRAALHASATDLRATVAQLHDALDRRTRVRRDLAELDAPEARTARTARLDSATLACQVAETHAQDLANERSRLEAAELALRHARAQRDAHHDLQAEADTANAALPEAETLAQSARMAHASARTEGAGAQATLDQAQTGFDQANARRERAAMAQAARHGADRRADLARRLEAANQARTRMENARAQAASGPDAKAMREIDQLAQDLAQARALQAAHAVQITWVPMPERPDGGGPRIGDQAMSADVPYAVSGRTDVDLGAIGRLSVSPGDRPADRAVPQAQAAFAAALSRWGVKDGEAAHRLHGARVQAERDESEARAVLESLAPEGIEALRAALAALPAPEDGTDPAAPEPDLPPLAELEARVTEARARLMEAQRHRDLCAERLAEARDDQTRHDSALEAARARAARASAALSRKSAHTSAADLEAAVQTAQTAQTDAHARVAEKTRTAPDLNAARAALARARAVVETASAEIAHLRPELAALDERIGRASGEAVEERLAETEEALARARDKEDRIAHEVAVLICLNDALEDARQHAREEYFAPVAAELRPLLHLLWPDAELQWAQDTLLPDTLIRNGQPEQMAALSGGTQEQLALLVRLAFARMLARKGRIAPVILDDALVYTDDDRIERMFDALHRQAADVQILVLTCRQRAFRDLGGQVLHLHTTPHGDLP